MSKDGAIQTAFDRSAAFFIAFVCANSLLAGIGWLINQPILASLRPEYIPMAPATVLILLGLCGAWLVQRYFSTWRRMRILLQGALLGMLILVIILALRYFTGLGPDLEKTLYPAPDLFGTFPSARMSPLSALGFILAILAFLFLSGGQAGSNTKSVSSALSLALLILSGLICLGYLYGAPLFYGGTLIPMALTSGISFWFLSLGLLMTAGPASWPARDFTGPSLKARLLQAFIPVSIIVVLVEGLLNTASAPMIVNPAVRVAVSVLVVLVFVIRIIFMIAKNLSAEFERGKQAEQALLKSEAELRALFAGMTDVVIVYDTDGRYIEIAPTNPGNLFRPPDEMLGKTLHEILPKEPADAILSMIRLSIRNDQVINGEYALQINSKEIYFAASAARLSDTTAIVVAHDITGRKRMEQEIRALSLTDELTGLFNRRGFTLLAEQEIKMAHREKRSMLLFFGDVDFLKEINDTHGHAQGDLVLQELSAILKETFREADILARIGGDEFVALALDAAMENADVLADRIQAILERRNQPGNRAYPLNLSLGIARYDPEAPSTVSELITQADSRMYQQKKARKGNTPMAERENR